MKEDFNHKLYLLSHQTLYTDSLLLLFKEQLPNFEVSAFHTKTPGLLDIIKGSKPDFVILDANGNGKEIWELLHSIHIQNPDLKILMLSNTNEQIFIDHARKNGAVGFVLKSSPHEILIGAIKITLVGGQYFDPGSSNSKYNVHQEFSTKYGLGPKEMEVIHLIKEGMTTKEIAAALDRSFHTIESHRKNIYNKLGIQKVAEMIKLMSSFES